MVVEDDTHVVRGPEPSVQLPKEGLGKFMIDGMLNNPNSEVMVCAHTGQTISYQQILEDSCELAESLRRYGCNQNSILALLSENHLKYFIPILASASIGSVIVPINPAYSVTELKHVMQMTQPKILFCSRFTVKNFIDNQKVFDSVEKIILIDPVEVPGVETMDDFIKNQIGSVSIDPRKSEVYNSDPVNNVAVILTSSGTTGLPKGVMVTEQNMQIRILQYIDPLYANSSITTPLLALLPFYHGFGITCGLYCLYTKRKMIVMKKFDEDLFLKAIQDYKMNSLVLAPPLVVFLAKSPKVDKYDLSSVTIISSGAASLRKETVLAIKQRLKNLEVVRQGYGLTECLAITLGEINITDKPGSVGRPATFTVMKIRDPDTGKSLGPNQVGEICAKTPQVMKGYYKNEKATKECFTSNGWLRTGDLGYYDEEGFLFIVDRLKELIKYKGFQVAPAELEALLLNHPKIMDAGVVGLPDELAGELPVAFVAKYPRVEATEKEIQDFVAERVSPQKRLRGGVIFVPAIPKNATGKILRRELRSMLAHHKVQRKSKL